MRDQRGLRGSTRHAWLRPGPAALSDQRLPSNFMSLTLAHERRFDCCQSLAGFRCGNDASLVLEQAFKRRPHGFDYVDWHDYGAVAIGMDQVAALYRHAVNGDGNAELLHMHVSVRGADRAGEHLKAFGDLRNVAH